MKNKLILFLISLSLNAFAQEVISTSGNSEQGVTWTIGEFITETITGENTLVTSGFIQPEFGLSSGLFDPHISDTKLEVFPNPVLDQLHLNLKNADSYLWELANVTGQIIQRGKANRSKTMIDFRNYKKGMYILSVLSPKGTQSIKIIKN